jgi:hypothetical protein
MTGREAFMVVAIGVALAGVSAISAFAAAGPLPG